MDISLVLSVRSSRQYIKVCTAVRAVVAHNRIATPSRYSGWLSLSWFARYVYSPTGPHFHLEPIAWPDQLVDDRERDLDDLPKDIAK
jgi:hypothetical protein